jgi:cytochrome c
VVNTPVIVMEIPMGINCFSTYIASTLLIILESSTPVPGLAADKVEAMSLLKKSKCLTCHSPDKTKDGPSYKKVAEKYKGNASALAKLTKHVTEPSMVDVDGEEEEHGSVKTRDEAKIKNLVEWILSL